MNIFKRLFGREAVASGSASVVVQERSAPSHPIWPPPPDTLKPAVKTTSPIGPAKTAEPQRGKVVNAVKPRPTKKAVKK